MYYRVFPSSSSSSSISSFCTVLSKGFLAVGCAAGPIGPAKRLRDLRLLKSGWLAAS
eukprot:m.274328 g.274328  ORF g.274328 m.274328 type:complete len:57 (+) comp17685_c0_seq5:5757-5927(+)